MNPHLRWGALVAVGSTLVVGISGAAPTSVAMCAVFGAVNGTAMSWMVDLVAEGLAHNRARRRARRATWEPNVAGVHILPDAGWDPAEGLPASAALWDPHAPALVGLDWLAPPRYPLAESFQVRLWEHMASHVHPGCGAGAYLEWVEDQTPVVIYSDDPASVRPPRTRPAGYLILPTSMRPGAPAHG